MVVFTLWTTHSVTYLLWIWRKIPRPRGSLPCIHQAQGDLCACTLHGRNMSNLKIWILEDYGSNK